jgi:ankyrin repeat protein
LLLLQDNKGDTPLHAAKKFGWDELAVFLVENGADSNLVNAMGIKGADMKIDEQMAALARQHMPK